MAAAQRAKPLKKQSCQGRGNQGAAAAAALLISESAAVVGMNTKTYRFSVQYLGVRGPPTTPSDYSQSVFAHHVGGAGRLH